jgi:hypothetical protein
LLDINVHLVDLEQQLISKVPYTLCKDKKNDKFADQILAKQSFISVVYCLDLSDEKFTNVLGGGPVESLVITAGPCSGKGCFSKSKIKSMLKKNPISIGIYTGENQVDFNDYD